MNEAVKYLKDDITCALVKGDTVLVSRKTGIRPMLEWIEENKDLRGFSAADRIVGKAAAMLFAKAGIKEVYAQVLSKPGLEYLSEHKIDTEYERLTELIINRQGDGPCPMEKTVIEISDPDEGYRALLNKSNELRGLVQAEPVTRAYDEE